ncbi:MAG: hypothetical protein OXM87_07475 [Truepera sp.]|nr:hypothetical protein [Truepera sp.]
MRLTPRQEIVLAALAADPGASFEPVQVQKLFFLLDENIANALGGKQFKFKPYDFGPFDKDVYKELEILESKGLVWINTDSQENSRRQYTLTFNGQGKGNEELASLDPGVQQYVKELSSWVRRLSFAQLVGSIYNAYPHMRKNSIFQG